MTALFFRQLRHLLPDALAWRVVTQKMLRRLLEGLSEAPEEARSFIDSVYLDRFAETTRELPLWEKQFGLIAATSTESARRLQLAAAWRARGGQSPKYLQDVLRAAGFAVYVHEWWVTPAATPRVRRDPRAYTHRPRVGTTQCGQTTAVCGAKDAFCNRWLVNEPGYLVNRNLTLEAPPFIPDAPTTWPYFIYVGGQTFGSRVSIPAERRSEFERLILKIFPVHLWIVTLVDYT